MANSVVNSRWVWQLSASLYDCADAEAIAAVAAAQLTAIGVQSATFYRWLPQGLVALDQDSTQPIQWSDLSLFADTQDLRLLSEASAGNTDSEPAATDIESDHNSDSEALTTIHVALTTEHVWWGLLRLRLPPDFEWEPWLDECAQLLAAALVHSDHVSQFTNRFQFERKQGRAAAWVTQQQLALAELSQTLKTLTDRSQVLTTALEAVCTTLHLPFGEVVELLPNNSVFSVKAVYGFPAAWVDDLRMAWQRSLAGFTLAQAEPVIVEDLRVETRFSGSPALHEQRIVSSLSLPLTATMVIAVHSQQLRHFSETDVGFLSAIAAVLTTALDRLTAEAEVNAFFDLSLDFLCIADLEGNFQRVNPRFAAMLGFSAAEMQAQPMLAWVHPEDLEPTSAVLSRMLQGDGVQDFVNRYCHRDGSYRWLQWNALPASGGLIYAIANDVTEHQFRERALREVIREGNLYDAIVRFCVDEMQLDLAMIRLMLDEQMLAIATEIKELPLDEVIPVLCDPVIAERQLCLMPVTAPELTTFGLKYYAGAPILDANDSVVGVISVVSKRPLLPVVAEILRIFAVRTQAELVRTAAAKALKMMNQILEARVTERTEVLAATEARLRITLDQAAVGIAEIDQAGMLIAANPYFCRMLGSTSLTGTAMSSWIEPADHELYHQTLLDQAGNDHELRFCQRSGKEVWVNLRLATVSMPNETFILAIAVDISQRRQNEAQLRLYKRAIEASSNGIVLTDAMNSDLPIVFANPAFEEITGYSQAEVVGRNCRFLQGDDTRQPGRLMLRRAVLSQTSGSAELRNYRKDGSLFWNRVTISPIFNGSGQLTHYLGIQNDITALKHVETQLQQQIMQQHVLEQLTQQVRSSLELPEILQTAVQELQILLDVDRVLIYQLSSDRTGTAIAEAVSSDWPHLLNITFSGEAFPESCYEKYLASYVYVLDDVSQEPVLDCMKDFMDSFNVKAKLVVPIIQGGSLWGLFIVHQCRSPRQWNEWEVSLLQALADQMAIAIKQSELFHRVQEELSERSRAEAAIEAQLIRERALSQLAQQTRQAINAETILAAAVKDIQSLLDADRVTILRLYEDGYSRVIEEAINPLYPSMQPETQFLDAWLTDSELNHYWQGKPRLLHNPPEQCDDSGLLDHPREVTGIYDAQIAAPILQKVSDSHQDRWVNGERGVRLWGLVVVHACAKPRQWLMSEADLVQRVADQLAIALQQSALFEKLANELQERTQAQQNLEALNNQLTLANLELARATRQKDEFLAMMSHELRTPLNSILGLSEVLQEGVYGEVEGKQAQAIGTIYRSGQHLLELINDILSLAKIEAGKLELHPADVNVGHLCDVCLTFFRQTALKKNIKLHSELPATSGLIVIADELRLRQALINLLSNAMKFTPEGGSVTLKVVLTPPDIAFQVMDTGIGIDTADLPKLFQSFVQLDSRLNRHYEGTGLGLALVKKIADLHGGKVSVSSELHVGSTFTITLPWQEGSSGSPVSTLPLAALPTPTAKPLVLIADDNEDNLMSVTDYLLAHGCRVVTAQDGATAVQMTKVQHLDLILMDVQMPVLDGIEAIKQVRSQFPILPILALTALTDDQTVERCMEAGATAFVAKPIRLRQLVQMIFEHLPQHSPK